MGQIMWIQGSCCGLGSVVHSSVKRVTYKSTLCGPMLLLGGCLCYSEKSTRTAEISGWGNDR